jgi:hypothetical protein
MDIELRHSGDMVSFCIDVLASKFAPFPFLPVIQFALQMYDTWQHKISTDRIKTLKKSAFLYLKNTENALIVAHSLR